MQFSPSMKKLVGSLFLICDTFSCEHQPPSSLPIQHHFPQNMGKPRRNIVAAAEESATPPDELSADQIIARVTKAEGNSLYTCTLPNTKPVLVELAERFRNTIWIKRGGFVLIDRTPSEERTKANSKVDGEIVNVVRDEKAWRKMPYWCVPGHPLQPKCCHHDSLLTRPTDRPKEFPKFTYEADEDMNPRDLPPSDSEDEV